MHQDDAIVIVPRSNRVRDSGTIREIARRLAERGHPVYWYEAPRLAASRRIDDVIARRWPRLTPADDPPFPRCRRLLRALVKTALALRDARRRDFLLSACLPYPAMDVRELGHFTRALPHDRVHFITHSAGSIFATAMAARCGAPAKVGRILCFGYPLRHPQRPPEPYRITHLPHVSHPLLVVQGSADPYCDDPALLRAVLPPHADMLSLACDHDYSGLAPASFALVWETTLAFLTGEACHARERAA